MGGILLHKIHSAVNCKFFVLHFLHAKEHFPLVWQQQKLFLSRKFFCVLRIHFLFVKGRFGLAVEGTKTGGCGHLESSR